MLRNRWYVAVALAVLTLSCARRYSPRPISAEAAAAFARAEVGEMGGSVVVDAEVLRELGFKPTGGAAQGELAIDLAVNLLPTLAAEMKDETGPMLARAAVLLALVREWAIAPHLQRVGVMVQVDPVDPARSAENALILLAVQEGQGETRELLQSMGAAVRTVAGRDLVKTEQGNLCVARDAAPKLPYQLCIHPGDGLIALGTAEALAKLATPAAPAARESGPLARLIVQVPPRGKGELVVEGHGALRVAARFESDEAKLVDAAEHGLRELLEKADAQREKNRTVMAGALAQVKESLGADPEAPGRMKKAVADAQVEKLLDPRGEYEAMRRSMKVARAGKVLTAELTIPEAQVRRAVQIDTSLLTTAATLGVLTSIAIPNFIKYQCRSKASEGSVAVKSAWTAVVAQKAERGAWPARLEQVAYRPPPGGRYTLCMGGGCLPPADPRAAEVCPEAALAAGQGPDSPMVCAAAEIDGKLDVWVLGESGVPEHVRDACQ